MAKFVWRDGKWVDRDIAYPKLHGKGAGIQYIPEIPDYTSPVTFRPITNRMERREDLKRSGSREVDPGERRTEYHNERFARKHGKDWSGMTDHPDHVKGGSGDRTMEGRRDMPEGQRRALEERR